tara:strand:+ start:127 stop:597 length:471 start_codon:yes stop_codon:yes gene_type:complete
MRRNIFVVLSLFLFLSTTISYSASDKAIIAHQFSEVQNFKELKLTGSERDLQISEIRSIKRTTKVDKMLRKARQRKTDYFISFQDDEGQVIFSYAIGNPFVIHLQHLGYEDQISRVVNDNAEIVIYYPSTLEPSSVSLKKNINEKAVTMDRISIME